MQESIGKVLGNSSLETFDFVSNSYISTKFVSLFTVYMGINYKIIGEVTKVEVINPYFDKPIDLRYVSNEDEGIISRNIYVSKVNILGALCNDKLDDKLIPPAPGSKVFIAQAPDIKKILKLPSEGIEIGLLKDNKLSAMISHEKFVRTHSAIIGQTGSGKSYLTAKLALELLKSRKLSAEPWRIATPLIFDTSGEYSNDTVNITDHSKIGILLELLSIGEHHFPLLNEKYLWLLNEIYELDYNLERQILSLLKGKTDSVFEQAAENDEQKNLFKLERKIDLKAFQQVRIGSTSQLADIIETYLTQYNEITKAKQIITPFKALQKMRKLNLKIKKTDDMDIIELLAKGLIVDLSVQNGLDERQIVLKILLNQLIEYARLKKLKSKIVIFIDEAHNYVPSVYKSFCKDEILTIAREGRKYGLSLCLISQRPRWVDPTALSQCGNIFIFRIQNSDDQKHIFDSASLPDNVRNARIARLQRGEAVIAGDIAEIPINCIISGIDNAFIAQQMKIRKEKGLNKILESLK